MSSHEQGATDGTAANERKRIHARQHRKSVPGFQREQKRLERVREKAGQDVEPRRAPPPKEGS